jgi:hypothetical protein
VGVTAPQTDQEFATILAKARTPPGHAWGPLAREIEAVLSRYGHLPRTNSVRLGAGSATPSLSGPLRFEGTISADPTVPFRIGDSDGAFEMGWSGGDLVASAQAQQFFALKATQVERLMGWLRPTVSGAAKAAGGDGPLIAPAGECDFCDRRRHYNSSAMRHARGAKKTGRKPGRPRTAIKPKESDDAVR